MIRGRNVGSRFIESFWGGWGAVVLRAEGTARSTTATTPTGSTRLRRRLNLFQRAEGTARSTTATTPTGSTRLRWRLWRREAPAGTFGE